MRRFLIIPFVLLLACSGKDEKVTSANLVSDLIAYGETHDENEVVIETSYGAVRVELYEDTPLHRAHFLYLANNMYYDKGVFYRVISNFMVQGGVVGRTMNYLIPAEIKPTHFHKRGAIAMARYDENNPEKKSSPTEFYIIIGRKYTEDELVIAEQTFDITLTPEQRKTYSTIGGEVSLDQKYTVFGEVTAGFDVLEKIANAEEEGEKPVREVGFKVRVR